jgi:UTP--glucose-1-phosphate uridylyltransferase
VIDPAGDVDADGVVAVRDLVEKPSVEDAPSDLILIGRYVLTPDVFDEIDRLTPGRGGELQLTDALRAQAARSPFHGVVSDIERFDTGTPVGLLIAAIELTRRDPTLGPELQAYLDAR